MIVGQNTDGSAVSSLGGHIPPIVAGAIEIAVANGDEGEQAEITVYVER
jgi:hypothetical protein